jgi:hypothetical protein
MKKSINLTLTTDETKEAIFDYLKRKNICIPDPDDAAVEFEEDGTYTIVSYTSYTKDIDDAEDKSRISIDVYSNENSYDDERDDVIKEILDIDSQPLPIRRAYFYLRSLNYFNREVTKNIISKDKDTIDNTIDLIKRIAHADVEKAVNDYSRR